MSEKNPLPKRQIDYYPVVVGQLINRDEGPSDRFVVRVQDDVAFESAYTVVTRDELQAIYKAIGEILNEQ